MSYGSKYDPSEFIVPPGQGKGDSIQIHAYIQAGHDRALHKIANSGVFPWGTPQDVIRWCIKYGLERLNQLEPQLANSVLRRCNMMLDLLREEISLAKHLEWCEGFRNVVQGHINRGDRDQAREIVARCYKQCLAMPDEPDNELRWKMKYLKVIEDNFREYLN